MNSIKISVRITNEEAGSWYRGRIGDVLEVFKDSNALTYNDPMYRLCDNSGNKIFKRNCEIVHPSERYPTISSGYCLWD